MTGHPAISCKRGKGQKGKKGQAKGGKKEKK
jgi:hypothetical protein